MNKSKVIKDNPLLNFSFVKKIKVLKKKIIFNIPKKENLVFNNRVFYKKKIKYLDLIIYMKLNKKKKEYKIIKLKKKKLYRKAFRLKSARKKTFKIHIKRHNLILNSNLIESNTLVDELSYLQAFVGDSSQKIHWSQENFIFAFKNKQGFYDISLVLGLYTKAVRFLYATIKTTNRNLQFVFAGSPEGLENQAFLLFNQLGFHFFPNDSWFPGFFTKNLVNKQRSSKSKNVILIVFNATLNNIAICEAVQSNIPVVAFVTPFCDIRNLDYPILLNLKNAGSWYLTFCKIILNSYSKVILQVKPKSQALAKKQGFKNNKRRQKSFFRKPYNKNIKIYNKKK